jgi:hypothetical protein
MIVDGNFLIVPRLVTKTFWSPQVGRLKFFNCLACSDQNFSIIIGFMAIKTILVLIAHKPTPNNLKIPLT